MERFEVRECWPGSDPTQYGIWDTKKNYFLPNKGSNGPWAINLWPVAVVACDLVNCMPKNALDSGEFTPYQPTSPESVQRQIAHIRENAKTGDPYERCATRYALQVLLGRIDELEKRNTGGVNRS